MTLDFNDDTHAYTLDGKPVPSVTEIVGLLTALKYSDTNAAIAGAGRAMGYVNPPSLMQRAVLACLNG